MWLNYGFDAALRAQGGWRLQQTDASSTYARRRYVRAAQPGAPAAALQLMEYRDGGDIEGRTRMTVLVKTF